MESVADTRVVSVPSADDWRSAILLAAALGAVAILPILIFGNVSGHDVAFHLPNWIDVARHWHEGVFYPHWSSGGHYGYGDPRFIIYPPFSWLLGGLLALVLPGAMLQGAYVWVCVAANALGAYRLAREWFSQPAALWVVALYATNPYLILVYTHRCAYSELLASAVFPIAFLFATRTVRSGREGMRAALAMAAAFACIWLSNVPAAVLGSYALGFVLLWLAIRERSLGPVVRGGCAMALGLALAAFYILPIALEMSWIQSEGAFAGGLSLWNNFLFHRSDDADHTAFNLLVSALACGEMALAGAAFPIALRRIRSEGSQSNELMRHGLPALCAVAALYAVILFPWSEPLWRILPRIWMAEFPWRSLYILNIALALAIVAAVRHAKRPAVWATLAGVLWLAAGGAIFSLAPWDPSEIHELIQAAHSERGYEGVVDEFLPVAVDPDALDADAPRLVAIDDSGEELKDSGITFTVILWNAEEKRFMVDSAAPARIRLHLVNYRAWLATLNGARLNTQTEDDSGQMVIPVPAGHSDVRIWFGHTPDRTLGPAVSLGALVLILLARRSTSHAS
jgi:6-pyruvoyl-tetrahydropterin synthase-like protein